jgi:membrane-associated protease RseP (regulator of RpoE activity)
MYELAQKIAQSLIGIAEVTTIFSSKREIFLKGAPLVRLAGMNGIIESRLETLGYKAEVLSTDPELVVRMRIAEAIERKRFPWVNLILFLLTGVTTILAGALQEDVGFITNPGILLHSPLAVIRAGLPFSLSLLAILLFHEFGHYTAARLHKVNVTLPYFIPAPTLLGTFGAFIRSKSAFMNKKQLLDVAAAGPLAGLVISIIVLLIGMGSSSFVPLQNHGGTDMYFGGSLLHKSIVYLIKGPTPSGYVLLPSSIAFAGWVGLLVTMFNLLPIGQLDGGHIMYALFGHYQKYLAYVAMLGLLALSLLWSGWAIWLLISILLKPAHPPTLMDDIPLGRGRRLAGYLSIIAFILCFMPTPVWYS